MVDEVGESPGGFSFDDLFPAKFDLSSSRMLRLGPRDGSIDQRSSMKDVVKETASIAGQSMS